MNIDEILAELERDSGILPRTALAEAVAHREEIIPRLLGVLEEVERDPQPFAADQERTIHLYAMYLLAQFREQRAYPSLIRIFSAPGELPFELAGDVVTQDLDNILASVSGGDPGGLMALVENEQANEWVRTAGMDGLVTLVASGLRTRDEVMAYFTHLFHTLERKPGAVWDGLANACADLCPVEVQEDLRKAYAEGLIDPGSICWEDIQRVMDMGPQAAIEESRHTHELITDTADAVRWWGAFHQDANDSENTGAGDQDYSEESEDDLDSLFPFHESDSNIPEPYRRPEPKIGRNEPCPCGSGKKYKKCCGR